MRHQLLYLHFVSFFLIETNLEERNLIVLFPFLDRVNHVGHTSLHMSESSELVEKYTMFNRWKLSIWELNWRNSRERKYELRKFNVRSMNRRICDSSWRFKISREHRPSATLRKDRECVKTLLTALRGTFPTCAFRGN